MTDARKSAFTLIEVMMAIVVIAIGTISIVGLVSASLTRGRDAMVDSRITSISTDFSTYLSNRVRGEWDTIVDTAEGTEALALHSGGTYCIDTNNESPHDPSWQPVPQSSFYEHDDRYGLYKAVVQDQFTASIRTWQEAVTVSIADNVGTVSTVVLDDSQAVRLFVEVSWPMEASYQNRRRHRFQTTIVRSQ